MAAPRMKHTSGSALLIVLVMLGLVAVLAAVIGRVVSGTAVNVWSAMSAERTAVGAEAGLAVAGAIVAAAKEGGADGATQTLRLERMTVAVALANERGRIDLNDSEPELLAGLFKALGVSDEMATTLAARIVDWRDADDDVEPGGAEASMYRAAGRTGPRNGPFVHPFELISVLGVDGPLAIRCLPYVTVANPGGRVDPFVADPVVLNALPGSSEQRVAEFIEDRALGTTGREVALVQLGVEEDYVTEEEAPGWRVAITATPDGGRPRRYEAVMIAGDDTRPYRVLYMLDDSVVAASGGG
jgi:general secretion pathway protein K